MPSVFPVNSFRSRELAFQGKSLSKGIVRGKAYLLKRIDIGRYRNDTTCVDLVSAELARLDLAVTRSKNQISRIMRTSKHDADDQWFPIFEATLELLNDPALVSSVKKTIEQTSLHGESVLAEEIFHLQEKTSGSTDALTIKSLITMQDLFYRLLYNLLPSGGDRIASLLKIPPGSILVANRLAPVEVAVAPLEKVAGILVEESAQYSHSSILARTLGIPVVIDLPGLGSLLNDSTDILIDAYRGIVFLNPSEATVQKCLDDQTRRKAELRTIVYPGDSSVVHSIDGVAMQLLCNASALSDVLNAHSQGIRDIGLFRSEIRYLTNTVLPTSAQDTAYYVGLFGVEAMAGMTVRLLDIGGDKIPVYMQLTEETDPQLGCRGIRFLLSHSDIMKNQIRAILAARGSFRIQLLLPFVTTIDDLVQAKEILQEIFVEMNISNNVPALGIMIEIPSVALSIERFLPKINFVCLGTNDLLQYFFAANRDQDDLQKYNRFTHPAFLKMLFDVIATCKRYGTPLTACGEMASDALGLSLLAAMGVTHFSVNPDVVSALREVVPKINVAALGETVPLLFDLDTADDVENKLKSFVN